MSQSDESIETVISEHGKSLAKESPINPSRIEERLDKLELLMEEMGQAAALISSFNQYVIDLKADLASLKRTRFWMLVITLLFLVVIVSILPILLFNEYYMVQDSYFKPAAFIAILASTVVLLSIMLKGAFHSLADRTKDDMVPPHLKEGMDALKLMLGK